jgi:hypothetical protein
MAPEGARIPVPSEVTLMCAGFAIRSVWMPFGVAVAAASAGNLLGSLLAYGLGRGSLVATTAGALPGRLPAVIASSLAARRPRPCSLRTAPADDGRRLRDLPAAFAMLRVLRAAVASLQSSVQWAVVRKPRPRSDCQPFGPLATRRKWSVT